MFPEESHHAVGFNLPFRFYGMLIQKIEQEQKVNMRIEKHLSGPTTNKISMDGVRTPQKKNKSGKHIQVHFGRQKHGKKRQTSANGGEVQQHHRAECERRRHRWAQHSLITSSIGGKRRQNDGTMGFSGFLVFVVVVVFFSLSSCMGKD